MNGFRKRIQKSRSTSSEPTSPDSATTASSNTSNHSASNEEKLNPRTALMAVFSREMYTRRFYRTKNTTKAQENTKVEINDNKPSIEVSPDQSEQPRLSTDTTGNELNRSPSRLSRRGMSNLAAKLKHKASSLGKSRNSEESTRSGGHSHTPSTSTLQNSGVLRPFPMIRSHSSISESRDMQTLATPSGFDSPRRKTDSDAAAFNPSSMLDVTNSGTSSVPPLSLAATPAPEEKLELPPRNNETPAEYAELLLTLGFGSKICMMLASQHNEFNQAAMRAHADNFSFAGEPIDMSLRKFLLYVHLPAETQQTERVLKCFSAVYHSQNPWVFNDPEQVYFVVFSMVILHTDFFNKNVRYKMSKADYLRSAYVEGVPVEIFEYIFDNITYTQFIHAEELVGSNFGAPLKRIDEKVSDSPSPSDKDSPPYHERPDSATASSANLQLGTPNLSGNRRSSSFGWSKDMVDPYIPILEGKLDTLRPSLGAVLPLEDPFRAQFVESLDKFCELRKKFLSGPTIELVSERSRPDAYHADLTQNQRDMSTQSLLSMTSPGVVDIKVVKVGILLRRESSKKMLYSKSTWREWGAILTESQLYLFKNIAWIRSIIDSGNATEGAITRTPMEGFNATAVLSTKDMAAIHMDQAQDQSCAFVLTNRGGSQAWFATQSEEDMMDWMQVINFAAAFSTYHVGPAPFDSTHSGGNSPGGTSQPNSVNSDFSNKTTILLRSASDSTLAATVPSQNLRIIAIAKQLAEVDRKMAAIENQIQENERNTHHLRLLAPMQQKTREALVFAAGQYSSKCEWGWIDRARLACYRNILELDLRVEEGSRATKQTLASRVKNDAKLTDIGSPSRSIESDNQFTDHDSSFLRKEGSHFDVNGHKFSLVNLNPDLARQSSYSSEEEQFFDT